MLTADPCLHSIVLMTVRGLKIIFAHFKDCGLDTKQLKLEIIKPRNSASVVRTSGSGIGQDKLKPSQAEVGINKENIEKGEEWNVGFFQIGRIEQNVLAILNQDAIDICVQTLCGYSFQLLWINTKEPDCWIVWLAGRWLLFTYHTSL
ncbi:uncharacterized protein LOC122427324 isoform X2 [Cervus canadensis]|uniref:uncharacterized protein LOC122427324 isoform X2 n=1 Tax=Cervus canadensis TaxID=1574408 RepID=UPI001CA347A9|nr:uncharacterized protein LOC122427324 isoform X2 [Cervus canadensis]